MWCGLGCFLNILMLKFVWVSRCVSSVLTRLLLVRVSVGEVKGGFVVWGGYC